MDATNDFFPGAYIIDDDQFYTDWMDRQGDNLIVQFEVLRATNSPSVTVTAWTKDANEPQSSAAVQVGGASNSVTFTTTGIAELDCNDQTTNPIKDQIRLKFVGTGGGEGPAWIRVRILEWVWFDQANGD